jgi:hypothetical protein
MAGESHWVELWEVADLATPMAVRVAATLRVADHIAHGACTAPLLADATGTDPDTLERLMRHLVAAGVVDRDTTGCYSLTGLGDLLRDDHPDRMRRRLDIEGAIGRADLSFVQLLHAVRVGDAAYPQQFGRSFWEDLAQSRDLTTSFDQLMGSDVAAEAPAIVAAYDWGSLSHVVDVGGGNGTLLIAMLHRFPALHGTVLDLPGAAYAARSAFESEGLSARTDVVAGSFFDALPLDAGGYVLAAILHNWGDEPALQILRRCAQAAGDGGSVFVIERMGPDEEVFSTERDLRMLAYFGGRERSLADLAALARGAGLEVVALHHAAPNAIVELATP